MHTNSIVYAYTLCYTSNEMKILLNHGGRHHANNS